MTTVNRVIEQELTAATDHVDPFAEIDLDLLVTDPASVERHVPAFWAGGSAWRARYSSAMPGEHAWRSVCTDTDDTGLHKQAGMFVIHPADREANRLYRHGTPALAEDQRHFRYGDGQPFLWLADTWWMGLVDRLPWPGSFHRLAANRQDKGFNAVQIVAGLYPEMPPFDQRGSNEAGFPWDRDFTAINPAYFDAADRRISALIDHELMPAIFGAWGYYHAGGRRGGHVVITGAIWWRGGARTRSPGALPAKR